MILFVLHSAEITGPRTLNYPPFCSETKALSSGALTSIPDNGILTTAVFHKQILKQVLQQLVLMLPVHTFDVCGRRSPWAAHIHRQGWYSEDLLGPAHIHRQGSYSEDLLGPAHIHRQGWYFQYGCISASPSGARFRPQIPKCCSPWHLYYRWKRMSLILHLGVVCVCVCVCVGVCVCVCVCLCVEIMIYLTTEQMSSLWHHHVSVQTQF